MSDVELRAAAEAVDLEADWFGFDAYIDTKNPADVAYIVAANPAVVLDLLDRLAAAEAAVERVRAAVSPGAVGDYLASPYFAADQRDELRDTCRWIAREEDWLALPSALDGPQDATGAPLSDAGAERDHGDGQGTGEGGVRG
jgi:hypothetical protein